MISVSFTIFLLQLLSVIYVGGEKFHLLDDRAVDFNIELAPFQVLVTKNPYSPIAAVCRGALVKNNALVTSALCITKISTEPKNLLVLNGRATNQSYWVNSTVAKVVLHPKFNQSLTRNNIAVIKLNQTFVSKPIAYKKTATKDNSPCKAYSYKPTPPPAVVDVNTTCVHACSKAYNVSQPRYDVDIDTMLCTIDPAKRNVICEEDVGASLVCDNSLAGLQIYTQECANRNMSSVYISISSYAKWIDQTVNSSSANSMSSLSVIIGSFISFSFAKLLTKYSI